MSIAVTELCKSFGERKVLDQISFEIGKQNFTLLGPNGAEKTTLVHILCGLLNCDSGKVSVCGYDPRSQAREARRRIGLVTQDTSIYEYLTARENLVFHANFYGVPKSSVRDRVDEALRLAQLENKANDLVGTFSGGMKRRLALVRAMLHDPEILVLDEPTLGVDVQNRNEIWNKILELKGKKTVFINTNYMDEADRLSDLCAIMDEGRFVAMDTPENLKARYSGGATLTAEVEAGPAGLGRLQEKLKNFSPDTAVAQAQSEGGYRISIPAQRKADSLLAEVAGIFNDTDGIAIQDLQVGVPTLNDVF